MRTDSGFTLIELTVAGALAAIILMAYAFSLTSSVRTLEHESSHAHVEQRLQRTLARLAAELRSADPTTLVITDENGANAVQMSLPIMDGGITTWSDPIIYRYEPAAEDVDDNGLLDEGTIVREVGGVTESICENVRAGGLSITRTDQTITIRIDVIGLQRSGAFELSASATVSLRNATPP